jgi:dTDP-4-amino-4,6-dideoxygalactose transaminase
MIPILDLVEQYHELRPQIRAAIDAVLESGIFIMGPNVTAFEREVATYLDARHAIAVNSGTDALHLALRALGIGPGDEVISTPFTFVATTEAIGIVGATPVFVDIDPATFNIDATRLEAAITARTKAILPIHLYGHPADLELIMKVAQGHGVAVVEDCAQAIGASVAGRKVGTIGRVGSFSFFPSKNLGAYGDGGVITTNDDALADRMRALRVHGGMRKYYHDELGVNSRLDELQAAILRVKLPYLDKWIAKRRAVAARYSKLLRDAPNVVLPKERAGCQHVYHQYTVRVPDRDAVRQHMMDSGVQTMVYYPVPLHKQRVFATLGFGEHRFEHAETAATEVLSLPMYPELSEASQDRVVSALLAATNKESAAV